MQCSPDLFPAAAQFCSMQVDRSSADLSRYHELHPLEQALVAHAVTVRKAEFGDARWCAHQALKKLGRDSGAPILRGERAEDPEAQRLLDHLDVWGDDLEGDVA